MYLLFRQKQTSLRRDVKFSFHFTGGTEGAKDTAESGSPYVHRWSYGGSESCYWEEKVRMNKSVGLPFV